ncbi:hypothetical protein ACFQXB_10535 [Plastorhodobacter daqingensis]|uniref:Uncharacterized protein n=1 Tax=Plastorhodobacter daqingensis TaxID=1387281 RepID=A0ABW2UIU9_9RHOB
MRPFPPSYISNFDSASGFLRATALALKGKDFPGWGLGRPVKKILPLASHLPESIRELIYAGGGLGEGIAPSQTGKVSAERIAAWVTGLYPRRPYPGVMIGSSNGALTHLATALGMPWLPQTMFVPVRQTNVHPDDAIPGLDSHREAGEALLAANPELQLHHMHDPNQDRLMLHTMTYFRVKWRRLAEAYKQFLRDTLSPGDPIILIDCQRKWPVTRVSDRYFFQFGALGGASEKDFFEGSPAVAEYLEKYGSHRRKWEPPAPDHTAPEAEWGFEPALRADLEAFAREQGHPIITVSFEEPEDLSPLVAEFHRSLYHARGMAANRLFVESFLMVEPHWTLRTGSVPYWMKFNMQPSLEALERYLNGAERYEDIHLTLFQHGVDCVGLPPIDDWRRLIATHASRRGAFLGFDPDLYPRDFGALAGYQDAVQQDIKARYPLPGPVTLGQFGSFIASRGDAFAPRWDGLPTEEDSR